MDGYDKEYCWINPHPDYEWFPGRIIERDEINKKLTVEDDQGETFDVEESKAIMVHGESLRGIEDLINLGDFNEGALLHNIRERYMRDDIYTSIGTAILVAMNPYKRLPIYDLKQRKLYTGKSIKEFERTPPHLFKMAENAYQSMLRENSNQSLIITGESGAGKTESTKYILRYLANIQKNENSEDVSLTCFNKIKNIEQKILYTNPVLEAFGNAKTVRNDNSSRFGKFIQIFFDSQNNIHSAQITNYLLENSRIVMQSSEERAYHIFYYLVNAADEETREKYLLSEVEDFPYINFTYSDADDFEDADVNNYQEMLECMDGLNFTQEEREGIFRLISAVSQLANVEVEEGDNEGSSRIPDGDQSGINVVKMLGIEFENLNEICCSSYIIDPGTKKRIQRALPTETAEYNRETLSKFLYSRMFDWIVDRVNVSIRKKFVGGKKKYRSIGLLDIFGFEIFEFNSFEQLCINYTNEKLQQHFNQHMFKLEKQEYKSEGIDVKNVVFVDNKDNIELIETKLGIFGLLDEQCAFKNGSDMKFLSNFKKHRGKHPSYRRGPRTQQDIFGIAHFAGEVIYNVKSFVEKNKNSANKDLNDILSQSNNSLISGIFSGAAFHSGDSKKKKKSKSKNSKVKSVSAQFKAQLEDLMKILNESTALYVRCIKPNTKKANNLIESKLVAGQLRCAGMLEAIRIRKGGYPVRRKYDDFIKYYKNLFKQFRVKEKNPKNAINEFLEKLYEKTELNKKLKEIQLGKTKVFMKEHVKVTLDDLLEKSMEVFVIIIQKNVRMFIQRRKYKRIIRTIIFIQNFIKGYLTLQKLKERARRKVAAARKITRQAKAYLARTRIMDNLYRLLSEGAMELEPEEGQFGNVTQGVDIDQIIQKRADLKSKLDNMVNNSQVENFVDFDNQEELKFNSFDEEKEGRLKNLEEENERLNKLVENYEKRFNDMLKEKNTNTVNKEKVEKLEARVKKLSTDLKSKESKLRLTKKELDSIRGQIRGKNQEITSLKDKFAGLALDDDIFQDIDRVNDRLKAKEEELINMRNENKKLRKMYGDLKSSVKNISSVNENTSKDELIQTLMNQVSDLQGQADLRESQVFLNQDGDLQRASISQQREEERAALLRKNDICKLLVADLTKLLKFKNFEVRFIQANSSRDLESEEDSEKLKFEKLMEKYDDLKTQEYHVLVRLKQNNTLLETLTVNDQVLEESEEYEDSDASEEQSGESEAERTPEKAQKYKERMVQMRSRDDYSDRYSDDQGGSDQSYDDQPDYWSRVKPNN